MPQIECITDMCTSSKVLLPGKCNLPKEGYTGYIQFFIPLSDALPLGISGKAGMPGCCQWARSDAQGNVNQLQLLCAAMPLRQCWGLQLRW